MLSPTNSTHPPVSLKFAVLPFTSCTLMNVTVAIRTDTKFAFRRQDYGPVVDDFVAWCDEFFSPSFHLNLPKTKYVIIDFRKSKPSPLPTVINGVDIDLL